MKDLELNIDGDDFDRIIVFFLFFFFWNKLDNNQM